MRVELADYEAARPDLVADAAACDPDGRIFAAFERVAIDRFGDDVAAGRAPMYSQKHILERLRWDEGPWSKAGGSEFAIDNDVARLWAMRVMIDHPEMLGCRRLSDGRLRNFFEMRGEARYLKDRSGYLAARVSAGDPEAINLLFG
jgi:hypothetical protein